MNKSIMKKIRAKYILISLNLLLLSSILSGCFGAGASTVVYNWPGLTIDTAAQIGYVAQGNHVYAVDLNNGGQKWRYPAEAVKNLGFSAPPAITDDGSLVAGSYDKSIVKVDLDSVQQTWINQGAQNRYYAGPLVYEQMVYASNIDNNLYAIDLNTGSEIWKFETGDALWSKPLTDGTAIYLAGMDHHVYALDPATGNLIWQSDDLGGAIAGGLVMGADNDLFVGTFANEMIALDKSNGKVLRRAPASGWVFASPVFQDGVLYFGDLSGTVFAIDAETFQEKWKAQPQTGKDSEISGSVLVLEDTIYFGNKSGTLYALDANSGAVRWNKVVVEDKIYAPVQANGDTLFVTPTGNGPLLLAFDLNGNQKWAFTPSK